MLRYYVETTLDAEGVGDLLTMAGFELEGIEQAGGEDVLDIKVMSNRGDGLSVFGLAREVLAKDPESKPSGLYRRSASGFESPNRTESISIPETSAAIESLECLRFACRGFDGVDGSAPSPHWMQGRLESAGMRPINILVDLTNYVMLELGQPLHAFDRDKLAGHRIVVRHARAGERLTTLNGIEHELDGQMMICDADKPVGVPGVMGGLETEVSESTTRLLLESANFRNTTVRKTRKQLGLNTEASYRFERSVDPDGVVRAIERFTDLLLESQPTVRVSNVVDLYPGRKSSEPIPLRLERANRLLGMQIARVDAIRYLESLGFDLDANSEPIRVTPPSWRPDLEREIDLIEELGRVHGYEKIPEELPVGRTPVGGAHGELHFLDRLRESLVRAGFVQILSHSLRDSHPLDAPAAHVVPKNPASPEMALLRNSLLPSLADAAVRNGGKDLHLFEMGAVFHVTADRATERKVLAILSTGALHVSGWQSDSSTNADFFSLKGALETALDSLSVHVQFEGATESDGRYHPTRLARVLVKGEAVGSIGQIHPTVAEELGLGAETYLAELDLASLYHSIEISYRPISRNPSVRRDISFEIDKAVPYARIDEAIASACGPELERHWLFDVYEGKGIGDGNHSLSVALQLRKMASNFTDEEANQVRERAVSALAALGAKPR